VNASFSLSNPKSDRGPAIVKSRDAARRCTALAVGELSYRHLSARMPPLRSGSVASTAE
jgi:hypothetical protein